MISDKNEHQRRLGQLPLQKTSLTHSAKVETEDWQSSDTPGVTAPDNTSQTIQQLSFQVETLTHIVAALMDQQVLNAQVAHSLTPPAQVPPRSLPRLPSQQPPNRFPQPRLGQPSI